MSTTIFDMTKPEHQKALGKLQQDQIAWFGSVRPDGRPAHRFRSGFLWHEGPDPHLQRGTDPEDAQPAPCGTGRRVI